MLGMSVGVRPAVYVCVCVCVCVCVSFARNDSAPIGWIFMKFDVSIFLEALGRKLKFY